ncbi:MAG TPA: gliding motility lipoprotein GldD [Bacteroidia bacterium]|nr:gliding motility lipoprotein GldD [Bacteroidia bacterium]
MKKLIFYCLLAVTFCLTSCIGNDDENTSAPKPTAFYKLNFPEKKYKIYDSICPFTFQTPVYSFVENDKSKNAQPCWLNIMYPLYRAQLYISYNELKNDLPKHLNDSRELAIRHQVKASGLDEQVLINDSAHVYGLLYDISGNSASAIQFYITDSTKHFLRGSLYFNCPPNIDSLKIVIDYLRVDIMQMIKTFKWKDEKMKLSDANKPH